MGCYNIRKAGLLTAQEIAICEMTFQGKTNDFIIKTLWPDAIGDKRKMINCKNRLTRLRKRPEFIEYYKTIVTEFQVHAYGKALSKIVEQIDSDQPWLANKAANDVLTRAQKAVLGEDENSVTVKIEGLPELGAPDVTDNDG